MSLSWQGRGKAELGTAISKATKENDAVTVKGITVKTNGDNEMIDITVMPVKVEKRTDDLLMVMFEKHPFPPPRTRKRRAADAGQSAMLLRAQ